MFFGRRRYSLPVVLLSLALLLQSCAWRPKTQEYQDYYAYLEAKPEASPFLEKTDYFVVLLVDARHLDYSSSQSFLQTMTKHPTNGCKDGSVGHAWLYLQGLDEQGEVLVIEGGHSGELGIVKPSYCNGITQYIQEGDENPARYLWESLGDGFFQEGNGGHPASYAARVALTKDQFWNILRFIDPQNYPYRDYSLTGRQCGSLVAQVAALVDLELDIEVTLAIDQYVRIAGQKIKTWTDEEYSQISFPSPDALEKSLMRLVREGKAEEATDWYRLRCSRKKNEGGCRKVIETLGRFPGRYLRHQSTVW